MIETPPLQMRTYRRIPSGIRHIFSERTVKEGIIMVAEVGTDSDCRHAGKNGIATSFKAFFRQCHPAGAERHAA